MVGRLWGAHGFFYPPLQPLARLRLPSPTAPLRGGLGGLFCLHVRPRATPLPLRGCPPPLRQGGLLALTIKCSINH